MRCSLQVFAGFPLSNWTWQLVALCNQVAAAGRGGGRGRNTESREQIQLVWLVGAKERKRKQEKGRGYGRGENKILPASLCWSLVAFYMYKNSLGKWILALFKLLFVFHTFLSIKTSCYIIFCVKTYSDQTAQSEFSYHLGSKCNTSSNSYTNSTDKSEMQFQMLNNHLAINWVMSERSLIYLQLCYLLVQWLKEDTEHTGRQMQSENQIILKPQIIS